jgi:DMSO/TMAO reductase YedYZ molybdopterin-dependent catalytic subunit
MNGHPPILHGAPLWLRVATQLGFTMVKYIRAIEFLEDYKNIGQLQLAGRKIASISARRPEFESRGLSVGYAKCFS